MSKQEDRIRHAARQTGKGGSDAAKAAALTAPEEPKNPLEAEANRGTTSIIPEETIKDLIYRVAIYGNREKATAALSPKQALDRINKQLDKSFNDGRAWEREFQDMKAEALLKDESVSSSSTMINGKRVALSKAEIRNELKAELREQWKTAQFKGKLSKRLAKLFKGKE